MTNEKRFEFTAFDCAYITDHQEHKDYPFVEKTEYIKDIVDLLNEQEEKILQYEILVKTLKDQNQKLKLRLKDLGVEYY